MAMTATSILICVIVLNLHHRDPNAPVPKWLRNITYNVMAPMVCMGQPKRGQTVYQLCEFTREYAHGVSSNSANPKSNHQPQDGVSAPIDENGLYDQISSLVMQGQGKKKPLLEEVVKHLQRITAKLREKDEQESLRVEWQDVAKILDRFFLMVFVLLVIISSVVLLLFYPMTSKKLDSID